MAPVYADHPFPLIPTPEFTESKGAADFKASDIVHCASEMACVHNIMIRGLNSIYLQAPHVAPKDEKAFLRYILYWHELIDVHHSGEETSLFPQVEKLTEEKGIMDRNVEQHHLFHDGIADFAAYVKDCLDKKAQYDGKKVVEMIDAFGPVVMQHLRDEIPTILGLEKYSDRMTTLLKIFEEEGKNSMSKLSLFGCIPWAFYNHDVTYEGGRWKNWPTAPWFVFFICRHISFWFDRECWKFASCDRFGTWRPLYAIPNDA